METQGHDLKRRMKGEDVRLLHREFSRLGFRIAPGKSKQRYSARRPDGRYSISRSTTAPEPPARLSRPHKE